MIRVSLASLRHRLLGLVAVFLVLAVGAVVVMLCASLASAGVRDRMPVGRFAGASAAVVAEQDYAAAGEQYPEKVRLPVGDVAAAARVPGVKWVAADVSVPARTIAGTTVTVHGAASAGFGGFGVVSGALPSTPTQVAITRTVAPRAAVGQKLALMVGGRPTRVTVTGIISAPQSVAATAFVGNAQALAWMPTVAPVDAILVVAGPGVSAGTVAAGLNRAFHGQHVRVLTGDRLGQADRSAGGTMLLQLGAVSGGLCGMLTAIIAAGTISLSVRQRLEELALLRLIGATPGRLRRSVVAETIVVAAVASAAAAWPFRWVSGRVFDAIIGSGIGPTGLMSDPSAVPVLLGGGVVVVLAGVSAWAATVGPSRVPPVIALSGARRERSWLPLARVVLAVLCLAGAIILSVVTATIARGELAVATAGPAALLWAGFFAAASPAITKGVAALARLVPGGTGRYLGVRNTRSRPAELTAATVTAVMLVVGLGSGFLILQWNQQSAARLVAAESIRSGVDSVSFTPGVAPAGVGALAALPGAATVTPMVTSTWFLPTQDDATELPVIGIDSAAVNDLTDVRVLSGSLTGLTDGQVALPASLDRKARVGQDIEVRFGDGTSGRLRVTALIVGRPGYQSAIATPATVLPHTTTGLVPHVLVSAAPGQRVALRASLARYVQQTPGAELAGPAGESADIGHADPGTWASYLLVALIGGYAVVALLNAAVLTMAARRREFELMHVLGVTGRQASGMVLAESAVTVLAGVGAGVLGVILAVVPYDLGAAGRAWIEPTRAAALVAVVAVAATVVTVLLGQAAALRTRRAAITRAAGA